MNTQVRKGSEPLCMDGVNDETMKMVSPIACSVCTVESDLGQWIMNTRLIRSNCKNCSHVT